MEQNLVIYTNLFTLQGRNVEDNRYIDMFYIWLHRVIKKGYLGSKDGIILLVDKVTLEFMKKSNLFNFLLSKLTCNFYFFTYEQPKSLKEGFLERFNYNKIISKFNSNTLFLQVDIDVLVNDNLRNLFSLNVPPNSIYLNAEANLLESNYYGLLASDDDKKLLQEKNMLNVPGFTAGTFAFRPGKKVEDFFNYIISLFEGDSSFYTVDQPFFNKAVFKYLYKDEDPGLQFYPIDERLIAVNVYSCDISGKPNPVLLNFCGEPGKEFFHWDKIFTELFVGR
jgi:hypothetical protein